MSVPAIVSSLEKLIKKKLFVFFLLIFLLRRCCRDLPQLRAVGLQPTTSGARGPRAAEGSSRAQAGNSQGTLWAAGPLLSPGHTLALLCVCTSHPSTSRGLHEHFRRAHSAKAVAIAWLLVHFWVSAHSAALTHSKGTSISRCLAPTRELKRAGNVRGFQQPSIEGKELPLPAHTTSFIPY